MMKAILLSLVLGFLYTVCASLSDPTPDEIRRGFEILPPNNWGYQARKQNSLRIVCIGGSNTAAYINFGGYVDTLREGVLGGAIRNDSSFMNNSYVVNNGISGFGPSVFTGKKYKFEELDASMWPNIIIVDCAVNIFANLAYEQIERLIQFFAWKFHTRGLPAPDIMFYNMPHLMTLYRFEKPMEKREDREAFVARYDSIPGVFVADETIREIATHYHLPVVSWGNATYAAGLRHFVEYGDMQKPVHWNLSEDGIHMKARPGTGVVFGMTHLLTPFFRNVMMPRPDDKPIDFSVAYSRLLPPVAMQMESVSYFAGAVAQNMYQLRDAFTEHSEWKSFKPQHFDYCYGSMNTTEVGEARLHIPSECVEKRGCRFQLIFLHSWNTSYIGSTSCSLIYHPHKDHAGIHISTMHIDGQENAMGATIPVVSEFSVNVTEGLHSVRCVNLVQDRLSCMLGINVNTIVIT